MSALLFDELARLSAALERFERDCPAEWTACGEWVSLGEAARAVEDAVAQSWPPPPAGAARPTEAREYLDLGVVDDNGNVAFAAVADDRVSLDGFCVALHSSGGPASESLDSRAKKLGQIKALGSGAAESALESVRVFRRLIADFEQDAEATRSVLRAISDKTQTRC